LIDFNKFKLKMSGLNFHKYVNISHDDLFHYLFNKKIGKKRLSSSSNKQLLITLISMITYREPKLVINRLSHLKNKSTFEHVIDNNIGTLLPINYNKKCSICKKNKATYDHTFKYNFYHKYKPCLCDECIQQCIHYSHDFLLDLAIPALLERYCIFRETEIYKSLINDISYQIFWQSL